MVYGNQHTQGAQHIASVSVLTALNLSEIPPLNRMDGETPTAMLHHTQTPSYYHEVFQ